MNVWRKKLWHDGLEIKVLSSNPVLAVKEYPVFFLGFFRIFLFSGESHLANFNFSKPFFQSNWKVKIKTHLNNIRIFQNLVFLFSGKRLFLPKWKILFPEKRKTCKQAPPIYLSCWQWGHSEHSCLLVGQVDNPLFLLVRFRYAPNHS